MTRPAGAALARALASDERACARRGARPGTAQARPAARSASATRSRRRHARARGGPALRPRGRRASAARCADVRARIAPAQAALAAPGPNPSRSPARRRVGRSTSRTSPSAQHGRGGTGSALTAYARVSSRRGATAGATGPAEQRADDEAARLGRQRLDCRPVPAARQSTCEGATQRHRQRPQAPRQHEALRSRTDARGTAGDRSDPARSATDRRPSEGR